VGTNLRFCSFCGQELILKILRDGSREKYCPKCDHVFFDSPYPAVIVAVTHTDKILITNEGLVAGHVKSGETAEEAAIREVREEVGLEVSSLQYIGTYAAESRNLLMIGFVAKSKGNSIRKSEELEKANWFKITESLPLRQNSIAAQIASLIQNRAYG